MNGWLRVFSFSFSVISDFDPMLSGWQAEQNKAEWGAIARLIALL